MFFLIAYDWLQRERDMSLAKFVACYGVLMAMSVSTALAEGDVADRGGNCPRVMRPMSQCRG